MTGRRRQAVIVNDRMQKGYQYERVAPLGRNFHPKFRPELTPKEMLELGVFCGKYMTDTRKEFPASWFTRAMSRSSATAPSTILAWMPVSHCQCGARRVRFIPTIRAGGSNGIAAIIWAGECQKRMRDRLNAGTLCAATWPRSYATANVAIRPAASARGRPSCTGPMTAERSEGLPDGEDAIGISTSAWGYLPTFSGRADHGLQLPTVVICCKDPRTTRCRDGHLLDTCTPCLRRRLFPCGGDG